ncbi:MAG: hypothetical protein IPN90_01160 [Elusimicrobia bacterium]|nr:hypothetical protein [Elusimicrobiota bacterium]
MAKKKTKPSKKPVKKAVKKTVKKTIKKTVKKTAKKPLVKKAAVKKVLVETGEPPLPWRHALPGETMVGVVDDYYSHLSVITLTLQSPLKVGDKIHVRGHTTDMTEILESMQINHVPVTSAKIGDPIGIKAVGKCRAGDYLYRVG